MSLAEQRAETGALQTDDEGGAEQAEEVKLKGLPAKELLVKEVKLKGLPAKELLVKEPPLKDSVFDSVPPEVVAAAKSLFNR